MVTLPVEYVATRYPGYFFNTKNKILYSVKVTGELRPLKLTNRVYQTSSGCLEFTNEKVFKISVKGKKRTLRLVDLVKIPANASSIYPVAS